MGIAIRDAICIVIAMEKPTTFDEALALWESHAAMAEELGVIYVTAQAMRKRGTISDEYWPLVVTAWKRRGITITPDDFLRMRRARREQKRLQREQAA